MLPEEKAEAPVVENTDPPITLGGKEWTIPRLGPKQNRIIVPDLLRLIPQIVTARKNGGSNFEQFAAYLDTATYDRITEICFIAVTKANKITREEFDELPIDTVEMINAVTTIARQAGLFKPVAVPTESVN